MTGRAGDSEFERDAPDTPENAAPSGFAGMAADDPGRPAYPKVRVVTVSECASHAVADAAMGAVTGKGAGEHSLARDPAGIGVLPDGSYSSVLVNPKIRGKARTAVLEATRGMEDLDEGQARYVRVVEYEVPDRVTFKRTVRIVRRRAGGLPP